MARLRTFELAQGKTVATTEVLNALYDLSSEVLLTVACGATHPHPEVERRYRALRGQEGHRTDGGCGGTMHWTYAYRCLDCGRWMHGACLREHFEESQEQGGQGA